MALERRQLDVGSVLRNALALRQVGQQDRALEQRAQTLSQQNALGAARREFAPGALAGDEAALQGLAGADPAMALQVQTFLSQAPKAARDRAVETAQGIANTADFIEAARDPAAAYQAALPGLQKALPGTPLPDAFAPGILAALRAEAAPFVAVAEKTKPTSAERNLLAAGLKKGTPEFERAMMQIVTKPGVTINQAPQGFRFVAGSEGTEMEPIPGGPADKPRFTEAQGKTAGFANRMINAERTLGALEDEGFEPGTVSEAAIRALPGANLVLSGPAQQYRQAQEDWVRSILRKESGAVIGEGEMAREIETFFPQAGDTPATIRQKENSRQRRVRGLIRESQGAFDALFAPQPETAPAEPAPAAAPVAAPVTGAGITGAAAPVAAPAPVAPVAAPAGPMGAGRTRAAPIATEAQDDGGTPAASQPEGTPAVDQNGNQLIVRGGVWVPAQ